MQTRTVTPPASDTQLSELVPGQDHCQYLILQAPSTNTTVINWGYGDALHELTAGDFINVPGTRLSNIIVKGDAADELIVSVF